MKDKLNDLIPWLKKLLQSLAKVNPDDDPEEVERRSQLTRFVLQPALARPVHPELTIYRSFNDIGTRSLALSEKGKVARVLDKAQDLQEVVGLVEKLRQAILIYQVGVGNCQSQRSLTRGAGIAATIDIQSSRPAEREFPLPVFSLEAHWAVG